MSISWKPLKIDKGSDTLETWQVMVHMSILTSHSGDWEKIL